MASADECSLGEEICKRTPYDGMRMPANWKEEIEWDGQPVQWSFRGENHRVARALRVPIIIKDKKGHEYRDWLLIGYEGHGI